MGVGDPLQNGFLQLLTEEIHCQEGTAGSSCGSGPHILIVTGKQEEPAVPS